MGKPFPYKVGDVINGVEILRIYTRDDVTEPKRKYVAVACSKCGRIRENIHPCDLKRGKRTQCNRCSTITHGQSALQQNGRSFTREYAIYHNAKRRAKKYGILFDLRIQFYFAK